jgi:hypothetical protein
MMSHLHEKSCEANRHADLCPAEGAELREKAASTQPPLIVTNQGARPRIAQGMMARGKGWTSAVGQKLNWR